MHRLKHVPRLLFTVFLFLIFFFPFYWMFITSVKTLGETVVFPPSMLPQVFQWENFSKAFNAIPFMHYLRNSVIITVSVLVLQMVTIIPAAYAFARYQFKGDRFIFGLIMITMMIPGQLVFLPLFVMFSNMGMINKLPSLILPFASSAFGIFMLRQTFKQVPKELIEAAKLDKAGELRIITKIMLPLARPTLTTLALLTFISTWNDYFWPLTLTTNDSVRTLPLGVASLRQIEGGINYHVLMAGNVMLIIPILIAFAFAQKQIIKAFTYMGDK
ncbi:MAG: carbohydrate ABC transporter permease [Cellulosilyticaceae bacterium]